MTRKINGNEVEVIDINGIEMISVPLAEKALGKARATITSAIRRELEKDVDKRRVADSEIIKLGNVWYITVTALEREFMKYRRKRNKDGELE